MVKLEQAKKGGFHSQHSYSQYCRHNKLKSEIPAQYDQVHNITAT